MIRFFALLALAAVLSACDTAEPTAEASVTVGATYDATVLALFDEGGDLAFDYLEAGASFRVTFEDEDSYTGRLFIPLEALVASGETDDLEGDVEQVLAGSYTQADGALTFTVEQGVDTFVTDGGWTVDPDGSAIRYGDLEDGAEIQVVLSRR